LAFTIETIESRFEVDMASFWWHLLKLDVV